MAELKSFIDDVINKFADSITDRVFVMIQNDKELMKDYLDLVDEKSLNTVNTELGKAVKKAFFLDNEGRANDPKSVLIQSYEKHKLGQ